MIPINFEYGFVIYITIWFCFFIFLWIKEIRREYTSELNAMKELLYLCGTCHHSFTSHQRKNITRCPKCNAICIFRKKGRF